MNEQERWLLWRGAQMVAIDVEVHAAPALLALAGWLVRLRLLAGAERCIRLARWLSADAESRLDDLGAA